MAYVPIILAAGESRRMGTPKALLDFGGRTCLDLVIESCMLSGAGAPIVVLGHEAATIRRTIPADVGVVINLDYERGQTSSLKAGLTAIPSDSDGILLFPVDCPLVRPETIRLLALTSRPIAVPVYGGRRGHPARFSSATLHELRALHDSQPAHVIVHRDPLRVEEVMVDDPGVVTRLNTPEQYVAALAAWRGRSRP
ncbi:MAG: nucleotidyltransferase family protein [Acidobacteria bacterium]|nr:nucleotidyltransferase family protein [Acidobacteriota bacterium]